MRFGKSLFSGCKELDGPEDGWSRGWMVVSGLRYRDQTNRIGLVVRGLLLS